MHAAAAAGEGDDLALLELALAVAGAQGRAAGDHEQHLLVGVVDVQRRDAPAGVDLVEGGAELLTAGAAPTRWPRRPGSSASHSGLKMFGMPR